MSNVARSGSRAMPGNGAEFGDGTIALRNSSNTIIGYISSTYDDQNGGFRELITVYRNLLSAPIDFFNWTPEVVDPGSTNLPFANPGAAEAWALDPARLNTNRGQTDRWFVGGNVAASVTSFPNPPSGFGFFQLVRCNLAGGTSIQTLYSMFTKVVNPTTTEIFELVARKDGVGLPVDNVYGSAAEESVARVSGTVSTGQDMEYIAASSAHFSGANNFDRYTIELTCDKLARFAAPPSTWF